MAISSTQNDDLQKEYDRLRALGQTKADATSTIKNTLQTAPVNSPVSGAPTTAYDKLKTSFQTGGVVGDWIAPSVIKPTVLPGTGAPTPLVAGTPSTV